MAALCDSDAFVFIAADQYSSPSRIEKAFRQICVEGYDAISDRHAHFVSTKHKKALIFDQKKYGRPYGAMGSYSMKMIKRLKYDKPAKWLEGWMWEQFQAIVDSPRMIVNDDDDWQGGLELDWGGNLTKSRMEQYDNPKPPFYETDYDAIYLPGWLREEINSGYIGERENS